MSLVGYKVLRETSRRFKKYNAEGRTILVQLDSASIYTIEDTLSNMIDYVLRDTADSDYVGIEIRNTVRIQDRPVWLSFRRRDQVHREVVLTALNRVSQSNQNFSLTDRLQLQVDIVRPPSGRGRVKKQGRPMSQVNVLKRSILHILGREHCLPKALIIAQLKVDGSPEYDRVRRRMSRLLEQKILDLLVAVGIPNNPSQAYGINELNQFQDYLRDYKIIVYSGRECENIIFEGRSDSPKRIYLYYNEVEKHYDVITNITGALCKMFYCIGCNRGFSSYHHTCTKICPQCYATPPCFHKIGDNDRHYCPDCHRYFRNATCLDHHKTNKLNRKKTVCQLIRQCKKCNHREKTNHQCFHRYCTTCRRVRENEHLCYMSTLKNKKLKKEFLYLFFDIESRQDEMISDNSFLHIPNLLHVQQMCNECENNDDLTVDCVQCGQRQHTFTGEKVIDEFIEYLRGERKYVDKIYVLAHNSRHYDCQFLLKRFFEMKWKPKLILSGQKIMMMSVEHIIFLDSLNFLPMCLRDLPKAFGFSDQCTKGYYPHFFNKRENVGKTLHTLPPAQYYGPDYMNQAEREKFFQWYNTNKDLPFDNDRELKRYCIDDVNILRMACRSFRKLLIEIVDTDPFRESITLSSLTNRVFRKIFLSDDTVSIPPTLGYNTLKPCPNRDVCKWFLYLEEQEQGIIKIEHDNVPQIPGMFTIDGYHRESNTLYKFFPCYLYGHTCMSFRDSYVSPNDIFRENENDEEEEDKVLSVHSDRYEETMLKIESIRHGNFNFKHIWECEWKRVCQNRPDLDERVGGREGPKENRIENIREALYGGRCESYKIYEKVTTDSRRILYKDIISLYPSVCKYYKNVIHHPKVYIGKDEIPRDILEREGILKLTILPPKDLYHPVLPYRAHEKLLFPLCKTCADLLNTEEECQHDDSQRALTGTWILDEIRLACRKGYKIITYHEFWEYQTTTYNRETGEGGLFARYIDTFLKIKIEASGFPSWVRHEEDKERFIRDIDEKEGIQLDRDKINDNPGRRSLAKLFLNTLWGRFALREQRMQTVILNEPQKLYELITNPSVEISKIIFPNDETVIVNWRHLDNETKTPNASVSVPIAIYVTAGARLKMYEYLEKLGQRVLYTDTDSCIYKLNKDEVDIVESGHSLGEMSNELDKYGGKDCYINEYVSGGPKNYAYTVYSPERGEIVAIECKVRGFTMNFKNLQEINFNAIKDLILNKKLAQRITVVNEKKIKRKAGPIIVSEPEEKKYKITFHKRRLTRSGYDSLPYGYTSTNSNTSSSDEDNTPD